MCPRKQLAQIENIRLHRGHRRSSITGLSSPIARATGLDIAVGLTI